MSLGDEGCGDTKRVRCYERYDFTIVYDHDRHEQRIKSNTNSGQ